MHIFERIHSLALSISFFLSVSFAHTHKRCFPRFQPHFFLSLPLFCTYPQTHTYYLAYTPIIFSQTRHDVGTECTYIISLLHTSAHIQFSILYSISTVLTYTNAHYHTPSIQIHTHTYIYLEFSHKHKYTPIHTQTVSNIQRVSHTYKDCLIYTQTVSYIRRL